MIVHREETFIGGSCLGGEISKAASSVPDNGFQPRPRPLLLLKSLSLLFLQTQSPCLRARKISLAGEAVSSHPSSSFPELRWVPVAQSLLLRLNLSSAGWQDSTRQRNGRKARRDQVVLRLHRKVGRDHMPLPAWDAEDVDESGGQGNHGGRKAQLTLWRTHA